MAHIRRDKRVRPFLAVGSIAALLAVAGCGGSSKSGSSGGGGGAYGGGGSQSQPASSSSSSAGALTLALGSTSLGKFVVGSQGRTLYLFEKDKGTTSSCYGACTSAWPPATTSASAQAGSGLNAGMLGTTTRRDGTRQVTYGGHPLYYYAGDAQSGQTSGQGLRQFGADWYVVGADGKKIDKGG
jgi:predicted lipoprotein with Yx(FWY)xxD motif